MSNLQGTGSIVGKLSSEKNLSAALSSAGSIGGSLSTNDYNALRNLPTLNGVTIQGTMTSADFGLPTVMFDTSENWATRIEEVSEENVVYVYTDYDTDGEGHNIAGFKVGDGTSYIVDLPFVDKVVQDHMANTDVHITQEEREFWNNKNRSYAYGETLILTTF